MKHLLVAILTSLLIISCLSAKDSRFGIKTGLVFNRSANKLEIGFALSGLFHFQLSSRIAMRAELGDRILFKKDNVNSISFKKTLNEYSFTNHLLAPSYAKKDRLTPYCGAGLGLYRTNIQATASSEDATSTLSESATSLGFSFLLGISFPFRKKLVLVETTLTKKINTPSELQSRIEGAFCNTLSIMVGLEF